MERHLDQFESLLNEMHKDIDAISKEKVLCALSLCDQINSTSNFFGQDQIKEVSVALDDVFGDIKDNNLVPDKALIEVVLGIIERIKAALLNDDYPLYTEDIERLASFYPNETETSDDSGAQESEEETDK